MFKIIKRGANNFWHVFNNNAKEVSISEFEVVLDSVANTFVIVFKNGANVPSVAVNVLDIIVIDETDSSTEYTFANVVDLRDKLVILGYTAYLGAGNADSITGLVMAGTNVTITGSGTLADPYVINSSGGGGGIPEAPNNTNAYVRSGLAWVISYTKTAIDTLLNGKFNNPIGNNTQYLDGTGTPTTFPTIPSAFNPSEHDLEEFLNEGSDPYARQSEVGGSRNLQQTLNNGSTAIFTHPLSNNTLIIEEVFDNSISYVSKKTATNSDDSSTTQESFSVGGISKSNSRTQDNIETINLDFNGGFSTIESDFNVVKQTEIYENGTGTTGNIVYELPTPKLGVNVVMRDPIIETPGTYTRATQEWVTANPPTIVVDADDVTETATRVFVTPSEKAAITHSNRSTLDLITEAFTTTLKTAYDDAVSWISTNGTNVLNHLSNTSNPHSVTKSQVGLSNVDNTSDVNKPVSTAQATADSNVQTFSINRANHIGTQLASTISDFATQVNSLITSALASFKTANFLDFTSSGQTQINSKVDKTSWIDISATSTIVGFASFTAKQIYYKKISDNVIWVKGRLTGTSNSGLLNFTIPFTSANTSINVGNAVGKNNGQDLTSAVLSGNQPNTNVVNIYRDNAGTAFLNSGVKDGVFSILIEI